MICSYAFRYCTKLESVTFSKNMTRISQYAFAYCTSLETVSIENVVDLDTDVFIGCYNLIYTEYDNGYYLGNKTNPYLLLVEPKTTNITSFNVNENCKGVAAYAFKDCIKLTSISLPDGIVSVGRGAFNGCTSLKFNEYSDAYYLGNDTNPYLVLITAKSKTKTTYVINGNCKVIGTDAFAELKYFPKITIPDAVIAINRAAFSKCSNLEYVKIGDGVTTIDIFAFDAIAFNSADIIIGESVSLIKNDAFRNYNLLGKNSNIYYEGSEEEWNNITINCFNAMEKFTIRYYSEEEPTENINNYWRYVDGVPTAW